MLKMTEMKNIVNVLGVYHDSWRSNSVDDIYLQVMQENNMQGIIDFFVQDEYSGYSILFYEFSKMTKVFRDVPPSKMKDLVNKMIKSCCILIRNWDEINCDIQVYNSNEHKDITIEHLKDYEYSEDDVNIVKTFLDMFDVSWDYHSVTIEQLELKVELDWHQLDEDDDEDDSDLEVE
jgi:hypothetical protein